MKRYPVIAGFVIALLSQDLLASPKTDSIVAFLGGAQAKFVWMKWAWCNDNYTPKAQAAAEAEGWSMELLDTREGTQRTLTTGLVDANFFRISRSGKWATFIMGTSTYIVDLTAASPTRKVLMSKSDCTYWAVEAWWIDPANGDEWAYCLENGVFTPIDQVIGGGSGIYKVKAKSDGTVDRTTATKLSITGLSGNPAVDVSISVSADQKKLGGAFPWPDTYILDIATGRLDLRHEPGFGCQSNLAPDNSYRFFHCQGDHLGFYMFDANMVNTDWFIDPRQNLAGLKNQTAVMDFLRPRWTNHLQYYVCTYPIGDNHHAYVPNVFNHMDVSGEFYANDGSSLWSKDANWVKTQIDMDQVSKVYMGKFSSDFKSQEKSILIASDPRYIQVYGDGWICNGTTYGSQCMGTSTSQAIRGGHIRGLSAARNGASVETFSLDGRRLGPVFRALKSGVVIRRNRGAAISVRASLD